MRLEKIVLNGFKSFADKTEFAFDAQVTGIVGPNGCGKSNVVDAVKWVLGEQKVKSLRSDQMTDVIFSGSGSRKPMGAAEVTLVLSNPDAGGTRQLVIDTDLVQITRKVFRTGESEYRINNKVCRLRDIRELFMDTGVCTKAYSIIEQGQIDQILAASAQDRRIVFEEAAGISKYKAHKKEALRKLERTEQNLLRLADILGEVGKRLRSVKLAAGKARNYLEHTQRLKELQVNYSLVEYSKNDQGILDKTHALEGAGQEFGQVAADLAKADTTVSELGSAILEKEHALMDLGNGLVATQSRIEQQFQRIEFLKARISELVDRRQSGHRQIERLQEHAKGFEADLARHEGELASADRRRAEKSSAVQDVEQVLKDVEEDINGLDAELEDEKSGIIDIVRRTAQLHNEIRSLGDFRGNLSHQKDRLASRAQVATAEMESLLAEKARHSARLADIEKVLMDLQDNLEAKRKETEQVEAGLADDGRHLAEHKEVRSALCAELSVLRDMEDRYEGITNAVKGLLKRRKQGGLDTIDGILADRIETDLEYATAVEAALEGLTDAVVVKDRARLLADKDTIQALEGRVRFVFRDEAEPFTDQVDLHATAGVKGRLVEFVRCRPEDAVLIWRLLGRVIIVDSLDVATGLAARLPAGYGFVTTKGEAFHPEGTICLGPLGKASGLISRKSRMRQLQETIHQISSQIQDLEAMITKNAQSKDHLTKLCKDLRTAVYEANTEKVQVHSRLTGFEQNIHRLRQEQPLISGEIDQLERQIAHSVQKEYESKQQLDELEAVNKEHSERIADLQSRHAMLKEHRQVRLSALTDLKVQLGQITEQAKAATQIIAGLRDQMHAAMQGIRTAQEEISQSRGQVDQAGREILQCEAVVSELFVDKEKAQEANRLLRDQIEMLSHEQRQTEQAVRDKRDRKTSLEKTIGDLRVELGQLEVRQQDLVDRVRDELQIDLAEAYKTYCRRDLDWEQVKQEILDLRQKIDRLGSVNLEAIDEQKELEERHNFLTTQVEDLNNSRTKLQQLIAKLNKTSREKFESTFEQIRENFQQLFRKLFGGGKADIILEEAEDILDAGIEIIARPPGKETRSISLLSGGERSMTAMALLFAIFRTKPSPFCFLDEVDAALDEANNERFNLIVREFQADTQFVVITHSKRTMSIADMLFGVTMQAQGVSKKISVRFDEYEQDKTAVA